MDELLSRLYSSDVRVVARWGLLTSLLEEYKLHKYVGPIKSLRSDGSKHSPASEDVPLIIAFEDDYEGGFPDNWWFSNPVSAIEIYSFITNDNES